MIDLVGESVDAIVRGDALRLPVLFAAGALSSLGPCVAPRYIAVAALSQRDRAFTRTAFAFTAGLIAAYALLGFGVGYLATLNAHAGILYAVLAFVLVAAGIVVLIRPPHGHATESPQRVRTSATFLLGAASALVISPCCTPIIAAVAAFGAAERDPMLAAGFLATFACGHALPLILLSAGGSCGARRLERLQLGPAWHVVSATLLLALGGYYGILA